LLFITHIIYNIFMAMNSLWWAEVQLTNYSLIHYITSYHWSTHTKLFHLLLIFTRCVLFYCLCYSWF